MKLIVQEVWEFGKLLLYFACIVSLNTARKFLSHTYTLSELLQKKHKFGYCFNLGTKHNMSI